MAPQNSAYTFCTSYLVTPSLPLPSYLKGYSTTTARVSSGCSCFVATASGAPPAVPPSTTYTSSSTSSSTSSTSSSTSTQTTCPASCSATITNTDLVTATLVSWCHSDRHWLFPGPLLTVSVDGPCRALYSDSPYDSNVGASWGRDHGDYPRTRGRDHGDGAHHGGVAWGGDYGNNPWSGRSDYTDHIYDGDVGASRGRKYRDSSHHGGVTG